MSQLDEQEAAAAALAQIVPIGETPEQVELGVAVARQISTRTHPANGHRAEAALPFQVCPTCGGLGRLPGGDEP
jgi:hypothetical protein